MDTTGNYKVSAIVYSCTSSLLVGYLVMSAFKPEGKPPWITGYITAILFGVALSAYSIIQKRVLLVKFNAVIVTVIQCVVLLIAYIVDSKSVTDAIFGIALFSVFTAGGPLWLVIIPFIWHLTTCASQK